MDEASGALDFDDAKLLNMVRAGDGGAFGVLYQRHSEAARRLARDLVVSPDEADDVVAETLARVSEVLRRGGGPADGLRPYVLTAVRRVCFSRLPGGLAITAPDQPMSDPGKPFPDPATPSLGEALIVRAYLSLPERWSALLWHTEIEQEGTDDVAPLFGLRLSGLAALERRARESLRQAYLDLHVAGITRQECIPVAGQLAGFLRYSLSAHDTSEVASHLNDCDQCRAVYAELADLGTTLRSLVAPVFLGSAAASYLSGTGYRIAVVPPADAAPGQAVELYGASGRETALMPAGAADLAASRRRTAGWLTGRRGGKGPRRLVRAPRRQRWLALGGIAALAIGTSAVAATLAGHHGTPRARGPNPHLAAGLPVAPAAGGQPKTSAQSRKGPAPSPRPKTSRPGASPTPGSPARSAATPPPSSSSPPGGPTPGPSPTAAPSPTAGAPPAPAIQLSASVDVRGSGWWGNAAQVTFSVTNTGGGPTGWLTVSVALPAGSSLATSGGNSTQWDSGQGSTSSQGGWTCQPSLSGASCQHAPVPAGTAANGAIQVQVTDAAACGQTVRLTAASGSASASAQSPETIQCGSGGGGE